MQPSGRERLSPPFHGAPPINTYSGNRGYASWRSLTPAYVLSPAERALPAVKTKADALVIGGQAPICRAVWRTEGERNFISPHLCGRQSISPVQARALSRRIAEKPEALGKEKK